MSFREDYRNEMNHIKHNKMLDEQILNQMNKAGETFLGKVSDKIVAFRRWKAVAAVIALVFVVAAAMNYERVEAYAESLYGAFCFNAGGDAVLLDDIVPIDFDCETLIENTEEKNYVFGNGQEVSFDQKYGDAYENYASFYENTGIELPGADELDYHVITFHIFDNKEVGHISMDFTWDEEEYHINGFFVTELYEDGAVGYGEKNYTHYVYEYAEGKQAYFVRDSILDIEHNQRVYFSEGGFVFQLFVENSEEGIAVAKEILNSIVE